MPAPLGFVAPEDFDIELWGGLDLADDYFIVLQAQSSATPKLALVSARAKASTAVRTISADIVLSNADAEYQFITPTAGGFTAALDITGIQDGLTFTVVNESTTNSLEIREEGNPALLLTLTPNTYATCVYATGDSTWRILQ